MSLEQPSQSNDYTLHPDHKMSVAFWQGVLSELHGRLNTLEAVATDWDEALADKATEIAEATFENSVAPQLAEVQDEIAALSAAIALAEDQLALIQQGGILAENVVLDPEIAGLADITHVQAALAELVPRTASVIGNAGKYLSNNGTVASWEDVPETEFATQAQAEAGAATGVAMDPLGTAQAIAAQVDGVGSEYQEFLTSGTWTKPDGVTWVYVEGIGGGGGSQRHTGGGGGGFDFRLFLASDLGATVAVTIGAGGTGVEGNSDGNAGGDTSFGDFIIRGGRGATDTPASGGEGGGGESGAPRSGDYPAAGGFSSGGGGSDACPGANSVRGGAGGAGRGTAPGVSQSGGDGGSTQQNGHVPGGGAGASNSIGTYNGAPGRLRVWAW